MDKGHYSILTFEEKLVRDYTGYSFKDIDKLDAFTFWIYLKDAFIYKMKQTDEGIEYLENAWRLQQTEPERDKLRRKYGKVGNDNV